MELAKARKGISRVMTGEILYVVSLVSGAIVTVLSLLTNPTVADLNEFNGAAFAIGVLTLLASAAAIAAVAARLIGFIIGCRQVPMFRIALIFAALGVLCAAARLFIEQKGPLAVMAVSAAGCIIEFLTILFGLKGVAWVGEKLGNSELSALSKKTIVPVIVFSALSLLVSVGSGVNSLVMRQALIGDILSVAESVLSAAAAVLFIKVLNRAKR